VDEAKKQGPHYWGLKIVAPFVIKRDEDETTPAES
jgi:hypothetical protein